MGKFFRLSFGRFLTFFLVIFLEILLVVGVLVFASLFFQNLSTWVFITFIVFTLLFDSIIALIIINSSATDSYKIAWLALLAILSFVGGTFYLIFGHKNTTKKMKKTMKSTYECIKRCNSSFENNNFYNNQDVDNDALQIARFLKKSTNLDIIDGTSTTYFKIGDDAFEPILTELKNAKHYIYIEFFIINHGIFWSSIYDILKQKAKEGLDIRLMYDDFGCIRNLSSKFPQELEKNGIKCCRFNTLKPIFNVRLNNRDHRKIIVIDGFIGFTGGINIADEYINKEVRFGHWLDNCIMLKGKGVYNLTQLFLSSWCAETLQYDEINNEKYHYDYYLNKSIDFKNDGFVLPFGDIPYQANSIGETFYQKLIEASTKFLYITTPYLMVDTKIIDSICDSSFRGVDVRILVPHIPDKKIVFGVTRSYYRKFIEAGVKIYEYTPGFVHEKIFVVDNKYASVGTINLDFRSLYLNKENAVFLYKNSSIIDMRNAFNESLLKSELITKERYDILCHHRKFYWYILRLFATLM